MAIYSNRRMELETVTPLIGVLVRAARASRILALGSPPASVLLEIARVLPAEGMFIAIEPDPDAAAALRAQLPSSGRAPVVSVISADPLRYLHKLSGPYDLAVHGGKEPSTARVLDRLLPLMSDTGVLVSCTPAPERDYNEVLAADPRLATACLPEAGVAISVKVTHTR